jgi:hypothetical protein
MLYNRSDKSSDHRGTSHRKAVKSMIHLLVVCMKAHRSTRSLQVRSSTVLDIISLYITRLHHNNNLHQTMSTTQQSSGQHTQASAQHQVQWIVRGQIPDNIEKPSTETAEKAKSLVSILWPPKLSHRVNIVVEYTGEQCTLDLRNRPADNEISLPACAQPWNSQSK